MSSVDICESSSLGNLSDRDFQRVRNTIYEQVGIDLKGKESLVEARLSKQLRTLKFKSFKEYLQYVENDSSGTALTNMVDALTTNHTTFLREPQHFDFLRKRVIPELALHSDFRIWSAACSSGEEPYSIAFTVIDGTGEGVRSRASILATDISTKVLAIAQKGVYEADRFRNVPVDQMRRHLLKGVDSVNQKYMIKPGPKAMVQFQRLNLMEDFAHVGMFSVIFCRNVMIYFDRLTQENLVNRLAARLQPEGYLFIGHAESLNGIRHSLEYVMPAVYRKSRDSKQQSSSGGRS